MVNLTITIHDHWLQVICVPPPTSSDDGGNGASLSQSMGCSIGVSPLGQLFLPLLVYWECSFAIQTEPISKSGRGDHGGFQLNPPEKLD